MAVRPLLLYPSPWLRARATPVDPASDPWQAWARDLTDTLAAHPGVGIAGPQIGLMRRIVVIDERRFRNPPADAGLRIWLNPRIVAASGRTTAREGCLSVPGFLGETLRHRRVEVATDTPSPHVAAGPQVARGFQAIVAQHEIDHLDGILFLDRLLDRRAALRLRALPAAAASAQDHRLGDA